MSIRPTVLGFALLCGALVLPSGPARAQEDPRKPQAEAIFAEGIKLHDAGRNAEALEKYRRAYDVYPSANILFGIARLEQLLGRSLDSLRHYREALESPLLHPKNRELGKEYVAELEKQLGRFDVKAPAGTAFTFGGKRFVVPLERPLDAEPGAIVLEGTFGNATYEGRALVARGARTTVEMTPRDSETLRTTGGLSDPVYSAPTGSDSFWTARRIVGASLAAVGVGAIVGGGFLVDASSDHEDRAAKLRANNPEGCADPLRNSTAICTDLSNAVDSKNRDQALGWTAVGIGGLSVLVGAGLLGWPSRSSDSPAQTTGMRFRPRGAGFELQGSF